MAKEGPRLITDKWLWVWLSKVPPLWRWVGSALCVIFVLICFLFFYIPLRKEVINYKEQIASHRNNNRVLREHHGEGSESKRVFETKDEYLQFLVSSVEHAGLACLSMIPEEATEQGSVSCELRLSGSFDRFLTLLKKFQKELSSFSIKKMVCQRDKDRKISIELMLEAWL